MIIKSMTRKAPTFEQLAMYIDRDADGSVCFARNLHYAGGSPKVAAAVFASNYRYLPPRKNGNALYHMVLVLPAQAHLDRQAQQQILQELGNRFCEKFAPDQLAWGRAHLNTDNPHIHLMVSANEVRSKTRRRLDKAAFANIQKEMEIYKERKFPELRDVPVYNRNKPVEQRTVTLSEGELVRRTNQPSRKQAVCDKLRELIDQAGTKANLTDLLEKTEFQLYRRGKNVGVIDTERDTRYRLKTLGLEAAFTALPDKHLAKQPIKSSPTMTDQRAMHLLETRQNLALAAEQELGGFERETSQ